MSNVTERCPWCESIISRSKFVQIETKIREEEQTKLADVEKRLRAQLKSESEAQLARQRQLIAERS